LRADAAEPGGDRHSPWRLLDGWRLNSRAERRLVFRYGEAERTVVVAYEDGGYQLTLDATTVPARGELGPNSTLRVELAGVRLDASVVVAGEKRHVFLSGRSYQLRARGSAPLTAAKGRALKAGSSRRCPAR